MKFLATVHLIDFLDTLVSLTAAFVLGAIIGAERQYRQRSAGLRTTVLVSLGAAAFVDLGVHLNGDSGAVRVVAYVVSGIGFLGAGVIMKDGLNVRGLNTAATLWSTAAVGACAGADLVLQAATLTLFILMANTLLRPLVNAIDRIPVDTRATEATYTMLITVDRGEAPRLRDALVEALETAKYPVRDVTVTERGDEATEIAATLVSTSVTPGDLDAVAAKLARARGIRHATWDSSTRE